MRLAAVTEGKRAMEGVQAARLSLEERCARRRSASGEELRAAAGGLVNDVTQAVAEATRRFASTADELRRAAQEMQRELSQTREELQKGVLDMPAEAVEASTAMRRAIAEQIDAINELSKIVCPQHRRDSALPHGASHACRHRADRAADPAAGTRTPSRRSRLPPTEPFGRPAGAVAVERSPSRRQRRPAPPAPASKPRGRNGEARGWVADLLRRASSSEAEEMRVRKRAEATSAAGAGKRSPAQVVESLNSLSIDIARAIDHEASVELWDRYKRGERNVFTRRLYTLQGQKTFDELRNKYERDGDFRQAVDNYIGDFERLLSQVSKDDSDPTVSRMYLTSDTGKVYTMLAHAAGRLD